MTVRVREELEIDPREVAKYFLHRALDDGEPITPLRMQKLVYYAYAWTLVNNKKRLFNERIEAWPSGPVIPSLYRDLKDYGRAPIEVDYVSDVEKNFEEWFDQTFPDDVKETLDSVYMQYMDKTAFDLVTMTHNERPWRRARAGLSEADHGEQPIDDEDIVVEYGTRGG